MSKVDIPEATKIDADLEYYSFDKVMSYNAIYNFIVGARGLGKTYGAKRHVIRKAISKGEEFIYLRRYKTEIKACGTWFADIAHEFPGWDFKVEGGKALCAPASSREDAKRKWRIIGYFIALSNSQTQKSVPYPNVRTIMYDEFIIEKGNLRYLPNEAKVFNDFYLTVDRWKDKTRVWFLANSLTITNPYFLEYNILPDNELPEELMIKHDGAVLAHFPDSAAFAHGVYKTRFGKFIQATEYANYAVGNDFADNHSDLLDFKTPEATYHMTIECMAGTFSVWIDWTVTPTQYYAQEKRPRKEIISTMIPSKMAEGKRLLIRSDRRLQYLRAAYAQGRISFDSPRTRNAFVEIYKG